MRTCSKCGAQFPDDELICPVCGQEVQLVPDYVTIESHLQEDAIKKEEEEKKKREQQARQEAIEARQKRMHRNIILAVCLGVAAAVALTVFVISANANKNANSFSYQYDRASAAYEEGDYDSAEDYIEKALKLNDSDPDALYLEAQILIATKNEDKAASVLENLIAKKPAYSKAYDLLIGIYESRSDEGSIEKLLKNCNDKNILAKYSKYVVQDPVIDPDGGSFDSLVKVTVTTGGPGAIYYTTDGSTPDKNSEKYTDPFELKEGDTTVRAVVITDADVSSNVVTADFVVNLAAPDAPKVTPASGTYTYSDDDSDTDTDSDSDSDEDEEGKITVDVPDGYTCYYAFDHKPSDKSAKYTKPIPMRKGEHIFYAVLCSRDGKMGSVTSRTYVYEKEKTTPTPTARPTVSPRTNYSAYTSESATDEPTPTPTPEPTEAPAPTEEPTPAPTTEPGGTTEGEADS